MSASAGIAVVRWPRLGRLLGRRAKTALVGHLDRLEPRAVAGWAADRSDFGRTLRVVLAADGVPVAMTAADGLRSDLKSAGIGEGRHGFEFATPNLALRGVRRVAAFALRQETAEALGIADRGTLRRGLDAPRFQALVERSRGGIVRLGELAVPEARAVTHRDQVRGEGPLAFLDVYDLLAFLERRPRVTGIQRVVAGLIQTTLREPSRYPPFAFCTPTEAGEVVVLPPARLAALVEKAFAGTSDPSELRRDIEAIRAEGERAAFRPGDRYVVTGAYWLNPDYGPTLLRIRAQGVAIGAYIYDLIPFTASRFVTATNLAGVVERGIEVLTLCDFFLTISAFVERQLGDFLAFETGRRPLARAVPLPHELPGVPTPGRSDDPPPHPRPFVLCVSTLEGRKNHLLLFEVWAALIRKHGTDRVPDLVLVGNWGWLISEFRERCEATGWLAGRIVLRQDVGDAELSSLYRACLLTTFPSFVEGWGLPVGESAAVGKLCIASAASSIPEVVGDFADYIDPHDPLGAVPVFERAIYDTAYRAARERRIAAVFRARTWEETTAAFHAAVQALAGDPSTGSRRVPVLAAGDVYSFRDLMSDVLRPWSHKAATLALAEGWHALEPWGAWTARARASLRFFVDEAPGRDLAVTLHLVLPHGLDAARLRLGHGDATTTVELHGGEPQPIVVRIPPGRNGAIAIDIASDPADARDDGLRALHVGLAALAVARIPDGGA